MIAQPRSQRVRRGPSIALRAIVLAALFGGDLDEALAKGPGWDTDPDRVQTGPLNVSDHGRRRVRGGRPEGASIHLAWAAPANRTDHEGREELRAFERATFPEGRPTGLMRRPPEAWMRDLQAPDLPLRWNNRTVEYLRYFKDNPKGRAMMRAWMRRAGRYDARLRKILREVGVPEDLALVVLAESGFNPRARSRVGAAGPWQFMEGTGGVYGLHADYWVDERFDVVKSTHAAALYLKDLRVRFGSWELALAAYNAGYGLVMTTIDRHNTNSYWALCEIESGLPYATTNYVPKIVAAALVARNRGVFGVKRQDVDAFAPADWIEVKVPHSTALSSIAKAIGEEPELIAELNAQLIRGRTPPRRGSYSVRIPRTKADAFASARKQLRAEWSNHTTHRVRDGETLAKIASARGITDRQLRRLNGVRHSAEVAGGVTLVVPVRSGAPAPVAEPPPLAAVPALRPGAGKRLVFFVATTAATPRTVERAFKVRWADVVKWNDLDAHARLQPGQVLQVIVPASFDAASARVTAYERAEVELVERGSAQHLEAALGRRGKVRRGYKIRKGDNLTRVGRRFDLTVGDLARINGFSREHTLKLGEVIVVYIDRGKTNGTIEPPAPKGFEGRTKAARPPTTAKTAGVPGSKR